MSTFWLPLYLLWLLIVSGRVGRGFGPVLYREDPEKVWNMDSEYLLLLLLLPVKGKQGKHNLEDSEARSRQSLTWHKPPQGIMQKCRFGLEGLDWGRWRWGGGDSAVPRGLQIMLLLVARAYVACSWSILSQPWSPESPGGVTRTSIPKGITVTGAEATQVIFFLSGSGGSYQSDLMINLPALFLGWSRV